MNIIKENNKLLIAKIEDKIRLCNEKNKITFSDFVHLNEKSAIIKFIKANQLSNYFFFGGRENSDREVVAFYPDKINEEIAKTAMKQFIKIVKIRLPKNTKYTHGEYLSGIMKLGVAREKFGDIVVNSEGADIIAFTEIAEYFANNLGQLTRFKNADISIGELDEIENIMPKFENINIIISSARLDNFVSELGKFSRGNASEYIQEGKVFVNGENEFKESKKIKEGDVITIRGKGKFIIGELVGETRSGRLKVIIRKF